MFTFVYYYCTTSKYGEFVDEMWCLLHKYSFRAVRIVWCCNRILISVCRYLSRKKQPKNDFCRQSIGSRSFFRWLYREFNWNMEQSITRMLQYTSRSLMLSKYGFSKLIFKNGCVRYVIIFKWTSFWWWIFDVKQRVIILSWVISQLIIEYLFLFFLFFINGTKTPALATVAVFSGHWH